jgi:ribose 5-phosphate isomerase B
MLKFGYSPMKIALAADHAGFVLKEKLRERLTRQGHQVEDFGTHSEESTDYPDYAAAVGRAVSGGRAERGILVCTTGVGMAIAANKVPGIRAALAMNEEEVRLTREHNDANVLTISSRYTPEEQAGEFVDVFLKTAFSQGPRHARRIAKIAELEEKVIQS